MKGNLFESRRLRLELQLAGIVLYDADVAIWKAVGGFRLDIEREPHFGAACPQQLKNHCADDGIEGLD